MKKNFIDINNIANIKFLKCYKIVFKKNNIKHNLGFYIMNSIFLLFFLCLFLFYCRYYNLLIDEIIGLIFIRKKHSNCKNINSSKKKLIDINKSNKKKINIKKNIKSKTKSKIKKEIKTKLY